MLTVKKLDPKYLKKIYIVSQGADSAPPLGTVLGNLGVNTVTFCTNFNIFTKTIPPYFLLQVKISIFDNRSTSFDIDLPSTGYILNLLKFEKSIKVKVFDRFNEQIILCVLLNELVALAKFKLAHLSIKQSIQMVFGSAKSMGLQIIRK